MSISLQPGAVRHESVGGTRDISKSCNLIGYAEIPATKNKWLIGNAPGPLPAHGGIERAWLREARILQAPW